MNNISLSTLLSTALIMRSINVKRQKTLAYNRRSVRYPSRAAVSILAFSFHKTILLIGTKFVKFINNRLKKFNT